MLDTETLQLLKLAYSDKIHIKKLRCSAIIGCKEEERRLPQSLIMNITLYLCTAEAAKSDDLHKTVHYSHLSKDVLAFTNKSRCQLLETLAEQLADFCLKKYPLNAIKIEICKPAGIAHAETAAVEITRWK